MSRETIALASTIITNVMNAGLLIGLIGSIYLHSAVLPSVHVLSRIFGNTVSSDSQNGNRIGVDPAQSPTRKSSGKFEYGGAMNHAFQAEKKRIRDKATLIHVHHVMAVVTLIFSEIGSIDPSAIRGIYNFGVWYLTFVIIQTIAFAFIIYWTMCWVQFLAKYMKMNARFVEIACNVMTFVQVSGLLLCGIIQDSTLLRKDTESCKEFMDPWIFIVGATIGWQMILICFFTFGTVQYLKNSPASEKQIQTDVKKIMHRSAAILSLCMFFIFLVVAAFLMDIKNTFCADAPYNWLIITVSSVSGGPAGIYLMIVYFLGKEFRDANKKLTAAPTPTATPVSPMPRTSTSAVVSSGSGVQILPFEDLGSHSANASV